MESPISRRIEKSIKALKRNDYEDSLLNCFPALDKTASIRRPSDGVGNRFKSFIKDQWRIIAPIGLGSLMGKGCTFGGMTYENAIYKLARNCLIHEGEFSSNMRFTSKDVSVVGGEWALSEKNIFALIISVVTAKENGQLLLSPDIDLRFFGEATSVNRLWGKEDEIRIKIEEIFKTSR
jgi:hypothetical protein